MKPKDWNDVNCFKECFSCEHHVIDDQGMHYCDNLEPHKTIPGGYCRCWNPRHTKRNKEDSK